MQTFDFRKLPCPQPVIRCRNLLATEVPSAFKVLVDNDAAVENVKRFLEQHDFTILVHAEGKDFVLTANHNISDAPLASTTTQGDAEKIIIFITTETMGRGDDELGSKLMNSFLSTLPEMGKNLWRIILLNGGVKLSATEGPALQALRLLEDTGVPVFVCGTCLAHYKLTDRKQVGQTSNMLDIVTSLQMADKVIRP